MQNETNDHLPLPVTSDADNETLLQQAASPNLKAARESKSLSVGDVAYALKVSPRVINALEAGDWDKLPGRTFTVGILRAYGRYIDLSVDTLVDAIPGASAAAVKRTASTRTGAGASVKASRHDGESKRQTNKMLKFGIVMVLLALVLAYAVPGDLWRGALQEGEQWINRLIQGKAQDSAAENGQTAPQAPVEPTNAGQPAQAEQQAQTGTGTLELRFSAPAWVEVRDHTGRIIYSQLNAAGTTQFITGAAPLDVMIGNAKQVHARWRDEPVKLDKLSGDDVARQVLR